MDMCILECDPHYVFMIKEKRYIIVVQEIASKIYKNYMRDVYKWKSVIVHVYVYIYIYIYENMNEIWLIFFQTMDFYKCLFRMSICYLYNKLNKNCSKYSPSTFIKTTPSMEIVWNIMFIKQCVSVNRIH